MRLKKEQQCDVLVIGSGIAGVCAAIAAAESGSSVILACKGKLFSGSSFYPGTWGLGLIGPADRADEEDLARTIHTVGCGMADSELVRTFVAGIHPAIERVRSMGIKLRRADKGTQKEYIPCFDHKHRDWNGIEFDSAGEIFSQRLEVLHVHVLSGWEVLELVRERERVCGAVLACGEDIRYIGCGAVVLATGGYGSIFKYHLCTEDVTGVGQHLAMKAGCQLVNMEFMQMMPGYITPAYKTVFNEKTFRFTSLRKPNGEMLLDDRETQELDMRSTHGPFTSRLSSKAVDLAVFRMFREDERGVEATYSAEMRKDPPEFVKLYFDWLERSKGVTMDEPIHIGIFAHAANGGIKIGPDASTAVGGLFAAGEVTGGMHGADRIGGLSTANGLVFGTIAGHSAGAYAKRSGDAPETWEYETCAAEDLGDAQTALGQTMFQYAMVLRDEQGLCAALDAVVRLRDMVTQRLRPSADVKKITDTRRFLAKCSTAESVLRAALLRKESRGSHYRTDYPTQDPGQERSIIVRMTDSGEIRAEYKKEV